MDEFIKSLNKKSLPRGRKMRKTFYITEKTIKDIETISVRLGLSGSATLEWIFEKADQFMPWLGDDKELAKLLGYKSVKKMKREMKQKLDS